MSQNIGVRLTAKTYFKRHATQMIDVIRSRLPNSTIVIEGTKKSLVGRGRPLDEIMPIFDRDNLVYAFHYYNHDDLIKAKGTLEDRVSNSVIREIKNELSEVFEFGQKHGVPVMVNEFGIWGQKDEIDGSKTGLSHEARATYVSAALGALRQHQIGLTWWALNDTNTPYVRPRIDKDKTIVDFEMDSLLEGALFPASR